MSESSPGKLIKRNANLYIAWLAAARIGGYYTFSNAMAYGYGY